jgi:hypothetical protein
MEMYTDERISKESFARGETIDKLIKETEDLYSEHFGERLSTTRTSFGRSR